MIDWEKKRRQSKPLALLNVFGKTSALSLSVGFDSTEGLGLGSDTFRSWPSAGVNNSIALVLAVTPSSGALRPPACYGAVSKTALRSHIKINGSSLIACNQIIANTA